MFGFSGKELALIKVISISPGVLIAWDESAYNFIAHMWRVVPTMLQ